MERHQFAARQDDYTTLNMLRKNRMTTHLNDREIEEDTRQRREPEGTLNISTQLSPGVAQVVTVDFTDLTNANDFDHDGEAAYFLLDAPAAKYYVWLDISDVSSNTQVDPAPTGRTPIQSDTALLTDNATAIAADVAAAIDAEDDFSATADTGVVTITCASKGWVPAPQDGATTPAGGSLAYAVTTEGVNTRENLW